MRLPKTILAKDRFVRRGGNSNCSCTSKCWAFEVAVSSNFVSLTTTARRFETVSRQADEGCPFLSDRECAGHLLEGAQRMQFVKYVSTSSAFSIDCTGFPSACGPRPMQAQQRLYTRVMWSIDQQTQSEREDRLLGKTTFHRTASFKIESGGERESSDSIFASPLLFAPGLFCRTRPRLHRGRRRRGPPSSGPRSFRCWTELEEVQSIWITLFGMLMDMRVFVHSASLSANMRDNQDISAEFLLPLSK